MMASNGVIGGPPSRSTSSHCRPCCMGLLLGFCLRLLPSLWRLSGEAHNHEHNDEYNGYNSNNSNKDTNICVFVVMFMPSDMHGIFSA